MAEEVCPLCPNRLKETSLVSSSGFPKTYYKCQNCGDFLLSTRSVRTILQAIERSAQKKALLSYAVRKRYRKDYHVDLSLPESIENILKNVALPKLAEQAANLIVWIAENTEGPGSEVRISYQTHMAIIGATKEGGVEYIKRELVKKQLLDDVSGGVVLTYDGWLEYERIKKGNVDTNKAFMAMPFNNTKLDMVFNDFFKPAVEKAGFDLRRIDEEPKAGPIDDRLRVEIRMSKFLVAELTHGNQGVYWESGFAEGLGKPVIYTCEKTFWDKTPPYEKAGGSHFDTNHLHTVVWENNEEGLKKAAEQLKITIRATLPDSAKMTDD